MPLAHVQGLLTILSKSSFRISAAMTTFARRNLSLLPDWLVRYRSDWLKPDVIADLTSAAVVIPKAMAYGTVAGLPVQIGLYTAFLPMRSTLYWAHRECSASARQQQYPY